MGSRGNAAAAMKWGAMFPTPRIMKSSEGCDCAPGLSTRKRNSQSGKEDHREQGRERFVRPFVSKHFRFNGWLTVFRAVMVTSLFSACMTLWVLTFPVVEAAVNPRNVPMLDESFILTSGLSSSKVKSGAKNITIEVLGEPNQTREATSIMAHIQTRTTSSQKSKLKLNFNDDDIVFEQLKRQTKLDQACQKHKFSRNISLAISPYRTRHVIVDDKYKILFHYVPKVACMTWKTLFTKLARSYHSSSEDVTFRTLSDYPEPEIRQKLRDYKKVIFVREPLKRFLSGYIRKFKGTDLATKQLWERLYGADIVKKYRTKPPVNLPSSNQQDLNITLSEFISYVTNLRSKAYDLTHGNHWLPIHDIGYACEIDYDFIGHYENLDTEGAFVLKWFGIDNIVTFPKVHESESRRRFVDEFRQVSLENLRQISSFYKYDYEMFGYSVNRTVGNLVRKIFSTL